MALIQTGGYFWLRSPGSEVGGALVGESKEGSGLLVLQSSEFTSALAKRRGRFPAQR